MAEDNNQENEKKSPIKLILMIVGGIVLLGGGIGVGIIMGGGDSSDWWFGLSPEGFGTVAMIVNFIVSIKSPSPTNKLTKLAAKFIPAATHPLHLKFLEVIL